MVEFSAMATTAVENAQDSKNGATMKVTANAVVQMPESKSRRNIFQRFFAFITLADVDEIYDARMPDQITLGKVLTGKAEDDETEKG